MQKYDRKIKKGRATLQTQNLHPRPNQRPFLTHRRAQIFKLLHQQERALASPYLLRPEQQVPSSQPVPGTTKPPKQRTRRRTTPPQPALKALSTLYFLSVGGAEASQNGFVDLIPKKVLDKLAIYYPLI